MDHLSLKINNLEKIFNWVLASLGLGLIVFAFLLQWWGFQALRQIRQMQRIPPVSIHHVRGRQNEGKGKFAWEVPAGQVFREVLFLLSLGQAGLYSTIGGWKEMEDN